MVHNDYSLIEEKLNVVLPDAYKKMMSSYPFQDARYNTVQDNLINEAEMLIELNLHFRTHGFKGKSLPEHTFIIGKSGNNSIFFVDLSSSNPEMVYFLDEDRQYNENNLEKYILSYNLREYTELTRILQDVLRNPKHRIKKKSDWIISLRGLFSREQTASYQ